nr:NAC domain-containing protein 92-like [Ipomoea batatas]
MENNGYGSSSVPDNAAVLPPPENMMSVFYIPTAFSPPENMMSGSTVFNIPTGLPLVDNIMPNLGWAAAAGNMDMLGRGGLPMNVSTYSGISTAWPPAEDMPNLGWTATGDMDGLGLGGHPMTVSTYPSISTVWTSSTGNMDILGSPITVSTYSGISTVENMANLNMPMTVHTECPPVSVYKMSEPIPTLVAVTSGAGPSMITEIEKAVSRSPYKTSQEGIMSTPDLQDQQRSEDSTRLWVKVEWKKDLFKFPLDLPTMDGLKTQVLKRLSLLEADGLKFMYKDEDGEMITIACEEDLHFCFQYFKSSFHKTKMSSKEPAMSQPFEGPRKQLGSGMNAVSSSSHYGGGKLAATNSMDPSSSRTLSMDVGNASDEVFGTRKWKWVPKMDKNKQQKMASYAQIVGVDDLVQEKVNLTPNESEEEIYSSDDAADSSMNSQKLGNNSKEENIALPAENDKSLDNLNLDSSDTDSTKFEEATGVDSPFEAKTTSQDEGELGIMKNMQVVKGINHEATGMKKAKKKDE